jgi:hypothetical protein
MVDTSMVIPFAVLYKLIMERFYVLLYFQYSFHIRGKLTRYVSCKTR